MKVAIVDTYYPDMLAGWDFREEEGYASELMRLLRFSFGTADFYSRGLTAAGCTAIDIVANAAGLQAIWCKETGFGNARQKAIVLQQLEEFKPDVVFLQNLSWFLPIELEQLARRYVLAGQCSCPLPLSDYLRHFRILFTSFPHYVAVFKSMGVKPVYLPLAFDPIVLERTQEPEERDIDVAFVGGLGAPSHWKQGMEVLETVAREIPEARFWGYGTETIPPSHPVRMKHSGKAFGLHMYDILRRSKIVLNRHGEVAQGWANNMRLYEATGCGALLLTEDAPNLSALFPLGGPARYKDPVDAVYQITKYLDEKHRREERAELGQADTMGRHTYSDRMATLADELRAA